MAVDMALIQILKEEEVRESGLIVDPSYSGRLKIGVVLTAGAQVLGSNLYDPVFEAGDFVRVRPGRTYKHSIEEASYSIVEIPDILMVEFHSAAIHDAVETLVGFKC